MNNLRVSVLIGVAMLSCGNPEQQDTFWDDPVGDVPPDQTFPDKPVCDIVHVGVEGNGKDLAVTVRIAGSFQRLLSYVDSEDRRHGRVLANLFLDADNDRQTGGVPMFAQDVNRPFAGYEFSVGILLGYSFVGPDGKPNEATGNVFVRKKETTQTKPVVSLTVYKYKQGSSIEDFGFNLPPDSREVIRANTRWRGNSLTIQIPYSWLGLSSGNAVRLCYDEQPPLLQGVSEDKLVVLR